MGALGGRRRREPGQLPLAQGLLAVDPVVAAVVQVEVDALAASEGSLLGGGRWQLTVRCLLSQRLLLRPGGAGLHGGAHHQQRVGLGHLLRPGLLRLLPAEVRDLLFFGARLGFGQLVGPGDRLRLGVVLDQVGLPGPGLPLHAAVLVGEEARVVRRGLALRVLHLDHLHPHRGVGGIRRRLLFRLRLGLGRFRLRRFLFGQGLGLLLGLRPRAWRALARQRGDLGEDQRRPGLPLVGHQRHLQHLGLHPGLFVQQEVGRREEDPMVDQRRGQQSPEQRRVIAPTRHAPSLLHLQRGITQPPDVSAVAPGGVHLQPTGKQMG